MKLIDISGQRFNRLTALRRIVRSQWAFRCDCGNEVIADRGNVKAGRTRSCGCLFQEAVHRPRPSMRREKRPCAFKECAATAWAHGLCAAHNRQRERGRGLTPVGTTVTRPFEETFWDQVDKTGECWTWTGHRNAAGYGIVGRRGVLTHRHAWTTANGPIPPGLFICHRCDNPPCVRPDHLFLGTSTDNNKDRARKGRTVAPYGEAAAGARLKEEDVRRLRALRAAGATYKALGAEFGVNHTTAHRICTRATWAHTP